MAFFSDQKGGNKLLSVAKISARQLSGARCCYQMTCGRRTLHQASVSVRMPRGEHRRKAFTLRHPHHRPSFLLMYSDSVLYVVSLFGCYIVLLLSVHVSVGVYCTDSGLCGLFSPPQKTANTVPLHTYQRMFLLARLRRRIK